MTTREFIPLKGRARDISNQRFGRFTAIGPVGQMKNQAYVWFCVCDCGQERDVTSAALLRGNSQSCGCFSVQRTVETNTTHGMSNSTEYNAWRSMIKRCTIPSNKAYAHYGGRGISVCDRWLSFENFISDMGKKPDGTSLDRIDNNGNYCPENCRWATYKTQSNNKRTNRLIEYMNRIQTLSQWCDELGLIYGRVQQRLDKGASLCDAFTKPFRRYSRKRVAVEHDTSGAHELNQKAVAG